VREVGISFVLENVLLSRYLSFVNVRNENTVSLF